MRSDNFYKHVSMAFTVQTLEVFWIGFLNFILNLFRRLAIDKERSERHHGSPTWPDVVVVSNGVLTSLCCHIVVWRCRIVASWFDVVELSHRGLTLLCWHIVPLSYLRVKTVQSLIERAKIKTITSAILYMCSYEFILVSVKDLNVKDQ